MYKTTLLLDMNNTFMVDEDRFDQNQDYSVFYKSIGGKLPSNYINKVIKNAYEFLDVRYPDPKYRESFPSVGHALLAVAPELSNPKDLALIEKHSLTTKREISLKTFKQRSHY